LSTEEEKFTLRPGGAIVEEDACTSDTSTPKMAEFSPELDITSFIAGRVGELARGDDKISPACSRILSIVVDTPDLGESAPVLVAVELLPRPNLPGN
jgi:hypothetical protein